MILKKELVFLSVVAMEIRKKQFFTYHSNGCYEQKMLHQKLVSSTFKLPLKILGWLGQYKVKQNTTTLKICISRKKLQKIKTSQFYLCIIHLFMNIYTGLKCQWYLQIYVQQNCYSHLSCTEKENKKRPIRLSNKKSKKVKNSIKLFRMKN